MLCSAPHQGPRLKTTLLAAAATALLLLILSSTGLATRWSGVQAGYLALAAYLAIFAVGRMLALQRASRGAEEAVSPPVQPEAVAAPVEEPPPVPMRNPPGMLIGNRHYAIKADEQ